MVRRSAALFLLLGLATACGGGGSHSIAAGSYRQTDVQSAGDSCQLRPVSGDATVDVSSSDTGGTVYVQNDLQLGSKVDEGLTLTKDGNALSSSSTYGWLLGDWNCYVHYSDSVTGSATGKNRFRLTLDETMTTSGPDCASLGAPSSCHATVQAAYQLE